MTGSDGVAEQASRASTGHVVQSLGESKRELWGERPLADRLGDFVKDAAVPVSPVFVRAEANRSRDRDCASRLRQRVCFAVDGLDDLTADALADHLVPVPVDHVRPRLQLPAAGRTPEHARCLPVLLNFELDLAAIAAPLSLHEHVVIPFRGWGCRVQPVGNCDIGCPWPEIWSIWDDDGALRHKAVSGVALAGNPERDRAADRTVVPLAAAVEGGRAGALVQMPQADYRRGRRGRRRAVAARDEREAVDLEALAGDCAGRAADNKDDRIAVVL